MNDPGLRWWPLGDHDLKAARDRTALALDAWSKAWFGTDRFVLDGGQWHAARTSIGLSSLRWYGTDIVAIGLPVQSDLLVNRALDFIPQRPRLSPDDMALLDEFERAMMDDLLAGLTRALDPSASKQNLQSNQVAPINPLGGLVFDMIDDVGTQAATIVFQFEILSKLRPPVRYKPSSIPMARAENLIDEPVVGLVAQLGSATIRLEEMLQLAAGDVIVLDRKLETGIDVLERSSKAPIASAKLHSGAAGFVLQLNEKN